MAPVSRALSGVILAAAWLALVAPDAEAQDVRTVSGRRQVADEEALHVDVRFGGGPLHIEPGARGELYNFLLRYDADRFSASSQYDEGRLRIEIDSGRHKGWGRDTTGLELGISPEIPVELNLAVGATDAEIELGGVRTRRLAFATGASDSRLSFSRPNPERLERLKIEAGAAAFHASGLGNANAERIEFSGGVGRTVLDFSGEWDHDTHVSVDLGLGSLTLYLPHGVGVKVDRETFLVRFDSQELIRRGDAYYSQNWDDAPHRLTLEISGAFGSINVRWIDDIS